MNNMNNMRNGISNSFKSANNITKNSLDYIFNNQFIAPVLGLLLIIYATLAAPKLPPSVATVFENVYFKAGFLFLIAYSTWKNPLISILASLSILIAIQLLTYYESSNKLIKSQKKNNTSYNLLTNDDNVQNNNRIYVQDNVNDSTNKIIDQLYHSPDNFIVNNTQQNTKHNSNNECNVPIYDEDNDNNSCNVTGYQGGSGDPMFAPY